MAGGPQRPSTAGTRLSLVSSIPTNAGRNLPMNDTTAPLPSAGPAWHQLSSHAEILLRGLQDGSDIRLGEVSGGRLKGTDMELDSSRVVMTPSPRVCCSSLRASGTSKPAAAPCSGANWSIARTASGTASAAARPRRRSVQRCRRVAAQGRRGNSQADASMAQRLHVETCAAAPARRSPTSSTSASADPSSARACSATRSRIWRRRDLRIHFVSSVDALAVARLNRHAILLRRCSSCRARASARSRPC
jgi:hypothetical protein